MKDMLKNPIVIKSKLFALEIIGIYKKLTKEKHEYVMSQQILRSGTSIGANIREGIRAQSKPDFISKLSISLKEASETEYWLELLYESDYIIQKEFDSLMPKCQELIKILTAIINSSKNNS